MRKLLFRQIRTSLTRFFAIMAIITLGVGFFTGLRVTQSAMLRTGGEYLDELQFFDFRLLSTLGLTQQDVTAVRRLPGVEAAEGAVSLDALVTGQDGTDRVFHLMSVPTQVNRLHLTAGRLPQAADECVLDSQYAREAQLGSELVISAGNDEDTKALLRYERYTVVGIVTSPLYLNFERGTTALGNGMVSAFACLPRRGFTGNLYTEITVRLQEREPLYSAAYDTLAERFEPQLSALLEQQAQLRYDTLQSDAQGALDEADAAVLAAEAELNDARRELTDGEQQADAAQNTLAEKKAELSRARDTLSQAQQELQAARTQLDAFAAQVAQAQKTAQEARATLDAQSAQLAAAEQEYTLQQTALAVLRQQLADGTQQLTALREQAALLQASPPTPELTVQLALLQGSIEALEKTLSESQPLLTQGETALAAARAELDANAAQLATAEAAYADGSSTLQAQSAQLAAAEQSYAQNAAQLRESSAQLTAAEETLAAGEQELADRRTELDEGHKKLQDGENELAETKRELADHRAALNDLQAPSCYTLGRDTNVGYLCFESDTGIVKGISNVFPLFFFLVAALVCITTMTRLVDEERTQIGTLKALGFSDGAILGNYLWYAVLASLGGCVAGFLLGSWIFPKTLWVVYDMMYDFDRPIRYVLDFSLAGLSVAMYLLCALLATWSACKAELREVAASLIRPKAPKPGKRIFLEKIPFLWSRLRFSHKVSARNVFRYKKRLFMMVLGLGGCMALLLTGLGLGDSISNIVDDQYTEISCYDCQLTFREGMSAEQQAEFLAAQPGVRGVFAHEGTLDASHAGQRKSAHLVCAGQEVTEMIHLRDADGQALAYPQQGQAVINTGLAEALQLQQGDTLTLTASGQQTVELTVSGIFENYIYHYIFTTPQTGAALYGEAPAEQTAYLNVPDGADPHEIAAGWLSQDEVLTVTVNADMRERVGSILENLYSIVLLVIACAGALAFIVLYNLTNININERLREIATLKVLGFTPNETAAYVFRENLVLTVLGALAGVPLGVWLHRFVMDKIRIDMVSFHVRIVPTSYLLAFALCFGFTLGVNLVLRRKIRSIRMAESLKAAE